LLNPKLIGKARFYLYWKFRGKSHYCEFENW